MSDRDIWRLLVKKENTGTAIQLLTFAKADFPNLVGKSIYLHWLAAYNATDEKAIFFFVDTNKAPQGALVNGGGVVNFDVPPQFDVGTADIVISFDTVASTETIFISAGMSVGG